MLMLERPLSHYWTSPLKQLFAFDFDIPTERFSQEMALSKLPMFISSENKISTVDDHISNYSEHDRATCLTSSNSKESKFYFCRYFLLNKD